MPQPAVIVEWWGPYATKPDAHRKPDTVPDIKAVQPAVSPRVRALNDEVAPRSLVLGRTHTRWRCGWGGRLGTDGSRHPTHEGLERPVDVLNEQTGQKGADDGTEAEASDLLS